MSMNEETYKWAPHVKAQLPIFNESEIGATWELVRFSDWLAPGVSLIASALPVKNGLRIIIDIKKKRKIIIEAIIIIIKI